MEIRATDASQVITLTTVCSHAKSPPNKHAHVCAICWPISLMHIIFCERRSWHTEAKTAEHPAVTLYEEEPLRTLITCCGGVSTLQAMKLSSTMGCPDASRLACVTVPIVVKENVNIWSHKN